MMFPIENNDTFLLFFHGLDSSNETTKYTCISREPKTCQTVNYRDNFNEIFDIYVASRDTTFSAEFSWAWLGVDENGVRAEP